MFSIKFIERTLKEYKNSLIQEFENLKKELTSKQIVTFKKYQSEASLSGMNVWLNTYSELKYFQEILQDLETLQTEVSLFQKEVLDHLLEDFGEEDFRFLEWERTEPNKTKLKKILKHWTRELKWKLEHYDKTYSLKEDSLKFYFKASSNPSQVGANVKLISKRTPQEKIEQLRHAEEELKKFFPYGYNLYKSLTQKVIIVQSKDLVSYSFFHEPGISYINVIDRNLLQTIDDLIHENAHHHLNLILKKYKILKPKKTKKVFYSPWRKELRSLYAILHAVFTFSFGAKLFFAIANNWNQIPSRLTQKDFEICCLRFLEETLMLEYSLLDLNQNLGSFTKKGVQLIQALSLWNDENLKFYNSFKENITRKNFLEKISHLKKTLAIARKEYTDSYENPPRREEKHKDHPH